MDGVDDGYHRSQCEYPRPGNLTVPPVLIKTAHTARVHWKPDAIARLEPIDVEESTLDHHHPLYVFRWCISLT